MPCPSEKSQVAVVFAFQAVQGRSSNFRVSMQSLETTNDNFLCLLICRCFCFADHVVYKKSKSQIFAEVEDDSRNTNTSINIQFTMIINIEKRLSMPFF